MAFNVTKITLIWIVTHVNRSRVTCTCTECLTNQCIRAIYVECGYMSGQGSGMLLHYLGSQISSNCLQIQRIKECMNVWCRHDDACHVVLMCFGVILIIPHSSTLCYSCHKQIHILRSHTSAGLGPALPAFLPHGESSLLPSLLPSIDVHMYAVR